MAELVLPFSLFNDRTGISGYLKFKLSLKSSPIEKSGLWNFHFSIDPRVRTHIRTHTHTHTHTRAQNAYNSAKYEGYRKVLGLTKNEMA